MSSDGSDEDEMATSPTYANVTVIQTARKAPAAKPRQAKGAKQSVITNGAGSSNSEGLPKKRFYCAVENCPYSTPYAKDLTRHNRKHTGEKPFRCSLCPKSFSRYDKLHTHIRIHKEDRKFKCTICEYAAVDSGSLKKHIRTHTDERPFKCQLCSYSAKDSSQLVVHLRHHTGDTPYLYMHEGCDAAFKTTSDLQRHSRLHTGEKPYQCKHCDYKAAVKCNLNTHMRKYHRNNNNQNIAESNFNSTVSDCNDTVMQPSEYILPHANLSESTLEEQEESKTETVNLQQPNKVRKPSKLKTNTPFHFACKLCPYKADTMRSFSFHMRIIHNESTTKEDFAGISPSTLPAKKRKMVSTHDSLIFECSECPASFVRENSLRCHMIPTEVITFNPTTNASHYSQPN